MGEQKKIERTKALNREYEQLNRRASELNAEASELRSRLEGVKTHLKDIEGRRDAIINELERINRDL